METLRRRIPFKANEGEEDYSEERVLDEQEQEEVVEHLRKANEAFTARNYLLIQALLGLSLAVQLLYLFTPSKRTPLATAFPSEDDGTPIPLSTLLTVLSIFTHLNLLLLCRLPLLLSLAPHLTAGPNSVIKPFPFSLLHTSSAVGPTLSVFLSKPWQITAWWLFTPFVVWVTQGVVEAIEEGRNAVVEVEGLRYEAPGA